MISNKDYYNRNKGFTGDILTWYKQCVKSTDLFRIWFNDMEPDEECDWFYINSIIQCGNRYLLGLSLYPFDENNAEIDYHFLDDIKEIMLFDQEKEDK